MPSPPQVEPRVLAAALVCVALAAAAPGCARKTAAPPNVILITVDTLRADHLGCYGDAGAKTPAIDALARAGVIFEEAISQVPLTLPSHAAILTGTYPFSNGVRDFTGQPLSPKIATLAESFRRHGYATGAVVSSFVLDRSWGLARGFDFYDDRFSGEQFLRKDIALVERRAGESVDHALAWLSEQRPPFFLWLHLYDPHSPYDPPEPYRSRFRARPYDGEIAYADSQLGRLFDWLKQKRLYDRALMVFLSDHGESLGEHGESEHGFFIYDSTVRVPLIIKPPASLHAAPRRVSGPVESISVAPTMLQLAGIADPIEKQFQAASLAPVVLAGQPVPDAPAYSETYYPLNSFGWSPLEGVHFGNYDYIEAPQQELYDLRADPGERRNLAQQQGPATAALRQRLLDLIGRYPPMESQANGPGPSPEALKKLRSLGYVAYRAPSAGVSRKGLADPKAKLWEFHAILEATDDFRAARYSAGRALLKKVQAADSKLYLIPFMLGEAASQEGHWSEAAREFQKCLALNPYFDQAMMGLARALTSTGKPADARTWLNRALAINPQNFRAWFEMARAQARDNPGAARASLEKAISIQPNFAPAWRDRGVLEIGGRAYPAAAEDLEKAVQLGLEDAPTLNYLGIAYGHTGRPELAVKTLRRALEADPKFAQAHLNLGFAYQNLGQPGEARREYDTACRLDRRLCRFVPSSRN